MNLFQFPGPGYILSTSFVSESGCGAGNASLLIESGVLFSKKGAYAMGSGSLGLAVCRSLVVEAS